MGMTYIGSPTRTLYAVWTTRVTPTRVETEILPLRPSTVTNVMTTCEYGGDGNCWRTTMTHRMTESVTTRTRTVTGSPSVSTVSSPTATLFTTTRVPLSSASSLPSGMQVVTGPSGASLVTTTVTSSFSLPETSSKTLVGEADLPGGNDPTAATSERLRIAAIVGGLIGGFITPILLVFLIRYLLKRRRIRGGGSGFFSPPMRSSASFAPRALSPSVTLARSPTTSEGGHLAPGGVDRRLSRASRASRITHDPRYYPNPSPSASSHGHGGLSSHGHDPEGNPPVRRPSVVHYAPVPVPMRAASPRIPLRTPSPVLHRNGTISNVPPVPSVPYMPPMVYDPSNPLGHPVTIPPPTFASVPLASVAEGSSAVAPTPMEVLSPVVDPVPSEKPSTERTRHMPDSSLTNS